MDVEVDSTTVAASTTGRTDADADADVTALNIVDVGSRGTTTTTDGLGEKSDGVVSGGADVQISGVEGDGSAVATGATSAGFTDRKAAECGFGGGAGRIAVNGSTLTTTATDGLEKDAFGGFTGYKIAYFVSQYLTNYIQ